MPPPGTAAAPNPHREPSRFAPGQLARWQGLPLTWVDARPHVLTHGISNERPLLAMLDAGAGNAEFRFGRRAASLDLGAGAMGLFEPGIVHRSQWRCDAARRIMVDLDLRLLRARGVLPDHVQDTPLRQALEFRDPRITDVLRAMVQEVADGCPGGEAAAEGLSLDLVMRLWDRLGRKAAHERGRLGVAQQRRLDALIDEHLAEPLPLARLAEAAGCSAPHLARLMKASFGCTPHRYVLRRRVERACALLTGSTMPIAMVAAVTGFASQGHLTATLSRMAGTTPAALRRAG